MNTSNPQSSSAPDRPAPSDAIRIRAWAWLIDLRKRLNVGVQLVDTQLAAVLPHADGAVATALARALSTNTPPLRAALGNAMQSRTPHAVVVETLLMVCFPLTIGRSVVGCLVAAREALGGTAEAERIRGELELVGSTLSSAAEAHLSSPVSAGESGGDLERIGALARLLTDAGSSRTDHDMMAALAEALAVWHDIEMRAYVETPGGAYELEVALPGATRQDAPLQLLGGIANDEALVPLSVADEDRLGLPTLGQTVVTRVASGRGSWLLLFSGRIDPQTEARLAVYMQLLKERLTGRKAEAVSRLASSMAQQLLVPEERLDVAAARALEILERELGAAAALLSVTTANGAPLVRAGRTVVGDRADSGRLLLVRRAHGQPTVTLAVARHDGRPLTLFQCELVERGADLFQSWSGGSARERQVERRATPRAVDEVLEKLAEHGAHHGAPVSALVLRSPQVAFRPGLTQSWVAQARAIMRASDVVGMLGEGEIGFLLHGTTGEQAETAARRLEKMLAGEDPTLRSALSIGMATRVPGLLASGGIVDEAREKAGKQGKVVRPTGDPDTMP